jgi:hypothetical protein
LPAAVFLLLHAGSMPLSSIERNLMLPIVTLALFALLAPQQQPRPHIPASQLDDIATILAHDEGWPLGNPDYTLDPMTPDVDDGFDSIGLYSKGHLVRMYSINRATGDIVDFMRGCDTFQFEDLKSFQAKLRKNSNAPSLTIEQLASKVGCPKLTIVHTRWVK